MLILSFRIRFSVKGFSEAGRCVPSNGKIPRLRQLSRRCLPTRRVINLGSENNGQGLPNLVDSRSVIILAILGVFMNGIAVIRLSRTESMSSRAAFLHLLNDVLGRFADLIGAIAIRIWGIARLDPLVAVGISIHVLVRAVPFLTRF